MALAFWQITTLTPGLARSAKEPMLRGFPGAVTMTSVLAAKFVGFPASSPALTTVSICAVSADANTSALAPCVSWVASSEEPAKSNSTPLPGLSALNS